MNLSSLVSLTAFVVQAHLRTELMEQRRTLLPASGHHTIDTSSEVLNDETPVAKAFDPLDEFTRVLEERKPPEAFKNSGSLSGKHMVFIGDSLMHHRFLELASSIIGEEFGGPHAEVLQNPFTWVDAGYKPGHLVFDDPAYCAKVYGPDYPKDKPCRERKYSGWWNQYIYDPKSNVRLTYFRWWGSYTDMRLGWVPEVRTANGSKVEWATEFKNGSASVIYHRLEDFIPQVVVPLNPDVITLNGVYHMDVHDVKQSRELFSIIRNSTRKNGLVVWSPKSSLRPTPQCKGRDFYGSSCKQMDAVANEQHNSNGRFAILHADRLTATCKPEDYMDCIHTMPGPEHMINQEFIEIVNSQLT